MVLRADRAHVIAVCLQACLLLMVGVCYYNLDVYTFKAKTILEVIFLLVVAESICMHTYFHGTWKNFDNLFIGFFVFFLGNRLLFDLFTDEWDVCYFGFFLSRYVSVNILNTAILNLIIALLSYNLGSLLWRQLKKNRKKIDYPINSLTKTDTLSDRVAYTMLVIGFIAKAYFSYQTFEAMLSEGYLTFFKEGFDINRNLLMMFLETFYEISLFIIISRERKMRIWDKLALLFYIIMSLSTGQRGFAMLSVVFIFFYLYRLGKTRLSMKTLISMVFVLFFISMLMSDIRGGVDSSIGDIFSSFFDFFYNQSVSLTVIVTTIDYDDQIVYSFWDLFGHIRYLIEYYWNKITLQDPLPIDALTMQAYKYKWYGQYISSIANKSMFYEGMGLGSSYVAQLYAVGKEFAQVAGGIFVGYIACFLNDNLRSSNFLRRFWAFHALTIFTFIPRANLFEFISMQWAPYVVSFFIYFYIMFRNYKKTLLISSTSHV